MKILVAGISLNNNLIHLPAQKICEEIIKLFPRIVNRACDCLGEEAVVMIVLYEYALTKWAITKEEKDDCLKILSNAIKPYPQVILIPGSFAFYQEFAHDSAKMQKIRKTYQVLTGISDIKMDREFSCEKINLLENLMHESPTQIKCLANTTYIMQHNKVTQHRKCFPWQERERLGMVKGHSIFNIGPGALLKKIDLQGESIDVGILICRELVPSEMISNVLKASPLFQIAISNFIGNEPHKFHGALNIHMDKKDKLTVFVNTQHVRINSIEQVLAVHYTKGAFEAYDECEIVQVQDRETLLAEKTMICSP